MTEEQISKPRVRFKQTRQGHRFSLDSLLLAQSIYPRKKCRILELGCGCGVIAITIASRYPDVHIIGLDILESAVAMARENVRLNNLSDRITIHEKDLRYLKGTDLERFQYVICNPPFRKKQSGRPNTTYEKFIAREEITCTLDDILAVSRKMLLNQGELSLIYPAGRISELIIKMSAFNITPSDLIPIYTKQNHPAKWAIVKGRMNSLSELTIHSPLYPNSDIIVAEN